MKSKNINFIEVGYYHPSNANWSYRVHMVIDDTGARLYRETFGGDARAKSKLIEAGYSVETLHAGKGSGVEYKWRDVKDLLDIEDYDGANYGGNK